MQLLRACLNPRVLASLGIIGLAIAVLAPNLIAAAIPLLIVAACPLSMVVMMRAMSHRSAGLTTPADGADRVAELRRELAEISERQRGLEAELAARTQPSLPSGQPAVAPRVAAPER